MVVSSTGNQVNARRANGNGAQNRTGAVQQHQVGIPPPYPEGIIRFIVGNVGDRNRAGDGTDQCLGIEIHLINNIRGIPTVHVGAVKG